MSLAFCPAICTTNWPFARNVFTALPSKLTQLRLLHQLLVSIPLPANICIFCELPIKRSLTQLSIISDILPTFSYKRNQKFHMHYHHSESCSLVHTILVLPFIVIVCSILIYCISSFAFIMAHEYPQICITVSRRPFPNVSFSLFCSCQSVFILHIILRCLGTALELFFYLVAILVPQFFIYNEALK